ncbi:MAG: GNAT family N-acetyltransferase [Gaiellales bacterium]
MAPLNVRSASKPGDAIACARLAQSLPDHFDDHALERIPQDVTAHGAWLLVEGPAVVAFLVIERRAPLVAEILWIATRPDVRGQGHGTRLLNHALDELARDGVRLVEVKTLDASADYPPYEATRAFWERRGFIHVDTIDPFPSWAPGNPAAIYLTVLTPGHGAPAP